MTFNSSLNSMSVTGSSFILMGAITLTPTVTTPTFESNTFTSCGATSMSIEAVGCTWNISGQITLTGSGKLTDCTVDSSSASVAVSCDTLADVDGCTFISDGTGHAVDLGTISTTTSMTWDNTLSGYVAGSTGSPVSTGTSGNEAILVNVASGQTLTINVASGASIPSVKNDGTGSVNVVAGQVTLTITVKDIDTGSPIENARVYVTAAAGGGLAEGTVLIDKLLTDQNGQVSDTRSYSGNQPITGRVRKSSATPYYKTAPVAGAVSAASGLDLTIQMIPDE
jgi:hypothetical protein